MRRRDFIAGLGAVVFPLAARAQQGEQVRRVGVLSFGAESGPSLQLLQKTREELVKLGWIEGRNLRLEYRFGAGDLNRTRDFAVDLVRLAPDVIVVGFGIALRAVQQETKTIPIVVSGAGDIIENGFVKDAARPEGNITGFATHFGSLGSKWTELLKEVAPNINRVIFLPINPNTPYRRAIEAAAQSLGMQVLTIPIGNGSELPPAIQAFATEPNGGVIAGPGLSPAAGVELIRLATKYRLPAVYAGNAYLSEGALVTYGGDVLDLHRGVAGYVDRLLRGAKVSDLPVQYPTRFHLGINLKTAKALGLTVPQSILLRADEVIE
jgi:putative ABC transport system substrate-binding protein